MSSILNNANITAYYNKASLNKDMTSLCSHYEGRIKKIMATHKEMLVKKAAAAFYLDKVSNLGGHVVASHIWGYGYSSSVLASMEMIEALNTIKDCPLLTFETKQIIEQWIEEEKHYLPVALLMDGWRCTEGKAVKLVVSKDRSSEQASYEMHFPVVENEARSLAQEMVRRAVEAKKGERIKFLCGKGVHETRLHIIKKENAQKDMVFDLFYFNTDASITTSIACDISFAKIADEDFWYNLIKEKLTGNTDLILSKLLEPSSLCSYVTTFAANKSRQSMNSCPFQSVEADFKYQLIFNSRDRKEGLMQYKLVKALLADRGIQSEKGIDSQLYASMQYVADYRSRYIRIVEIAKDAEQFEQCKWAYMALLLKVLPMEQKSYQDYTKELEVELPLFQLYMLDNALKKALKNNSFSIDELSQLKKFSQELFPKAPYDKLFFYAIQSCRKDLERVKEIVNKHISAFEPLLQTVVQTATSLLPEALSQQLSHWAGRHGLDKTTFEKVIELFFQKASVSEAIHVSKVFYPLGVLSCSLIEKLIARLQREHQKEALENLLAHLKSNPAKDLPSSFMLAGYTADLTAIKGYFEKMKNKPAGETIISIETVFSRLPVDMPKNRFHEFMDLFLSFSCISQEDVFAAAEKWLKRIEAKQAVRFLVEYYQNKRATLEKTRSDQLLMHIFRRHFLLVPLYDDFAQVTGGLYQLGQTIKEMAPLESGHIFTALADTACFQKELFVYIDSFLEQDLLNDESKEQFLEGLVCHRKIEEAKLFFDKMRFSKEKSQSMQFLEGFIQKGPQFLFNEQAILLSESCKSVCIISILRWFNLPKDQRSIYKKIALSLAMMPLTGATSPASLKAVWFKRLIDLCYDAERPWFMDYLVPLLQSEFSPKDIVSILNVYVKGIEAKKAVELFIEHYQTESLTQEEHQKLLTVMLITSHLLNSFYPTLDSKGLLQDIFKLPQENFDSIVAELRCQVSAKPEGVLYPYVKQFNLF